MPEYEVVKRETVLTLYRVFAPDAEEAARLATRAAYGPVAACRTGDSSLEYAYEVRPGTPPSPRLWDRAFYTALMRAVPFAPCPTKRPPDTGDRRRESDGRRRKAIGGGAKTDGDPGRAAEPPEPTRPRGRKKPTLPRTPEGWDGGCVTCGSARPRQTAVTAAGRRYYECRTGGHRFVREKG